MGEKWPRNLPKVATFTTLLGSFTCRKPRHGTDGFTSPPKEGVLRIFSSEKSDGFGWVILLEVLVVFLATCFGSYTDHIKHNGDASHENLKKKTENSSNTVVTTAFHSLRH
jgi:hypothetical protein